MKREVITLTRKQLNTFEIISKANAGFITVKEAAEASGLSERRVQRLKKKVRQEGAAAVVHKNSLRSPHNKTTAETAEKIIALKKTPPFTDANFKHFRELLYEHEGIEISYTTLYRLLKSEKIDSPKTRRRFKPHRRRKRRAQQGLLLQVDATPYAWFKGDKKRYALHGGIDDATSQVTGLYMTKNECLHGYYEMMRRTIVNFGIPVSLYADRHTIFQSPNKGKADFDSSLKVNDTQFGRALKELNVELIAARSPQAKGRIERLWQTLQDRLPVEFALNNITSADGANEFLKTYIYKFNSEFALEPEKADNMFGKPDKGMNLDYILCIKEKRTIDSGGVFSYGGKSFKVRDNAYSAMIPANARVNILAGPAFGVKLEYRNIVFDVLPYVPPERAAKAQKPPAPERAVPDSHYYKYGQSLAPKIAFIESDDEIIAVLNDLFLRKYA